MSEEKSYGQILLETTMYSTGPKWDRQEHFTQMECELKAKAVIAEYLRRNCEPVEDLQDKVGKALKQAWLLGQRYWQQADSDSWIQHQRSDETRNKFTELVEETKRIIAAPQPLPSTKFAGCPGEIEDMKKAAHELGSWLSAALDDPNVCQEYKKAINTWFNVGMPFREKK